MKRFLLPLCALALSASTTFGAESKPVLDPKRIINESYNFLKNQEPEMAADEFALYEKSVSLIAVRPDYGFKLLETIVSGTEQKSPAFSLALGNVYYQSGRPEQAEVYYRKAIEQYPNFQRAWNNLGALLYSQGRYEEAVTCFTKVVSNGKADASTLGVLAFCQVKSGNPLAAEMNYVQALGLDPQNPDWISGLLNLALEAKQYGRAESLLKQLVRLKPEDAQNWVLLASVLSNSGRPVEAVALLDAAVALGYGGDDARLMLGDLCADQKLTREAIDAYAAALKENANLGAKRLIAYAQALIAAGHLGDAEKALNAIAGKLTPDVETNLLQTKAEFHASQKDWPAAQRDLEALLKLQPLDGPALLSLGRVYKAQSNLAAADLVLEQAARIPAVTYRACLELGDIAIKTQRYKRGVEYLEKALALEKTPALQQYLAKLRLLIPENENAPART